GIDTTIMVYKIPISFKLYNSLMVRIASAGNFIENTLIFIRTFDIVCRSIGNLLRKFRRICQVVLPIISMYPWSLCKTKTIKRYLLNIAINFDHIIFQLGIISLSVPPENPCLSVIVHKYRRIDTSPAVGRSKTIISCQQRLTQGVLEWSFGTIRHGYADSRPIRADIPIIFAVSVHPVCPQIITGICPE